MSQRRDAERGRGGGFLLGPRQVAGLVLLGLAVAFILQNRRRTIVTFIVPEPTAPLWLALLISGVLGFIIGALLVARRHP